MLPLYTLLLKHLCFLTGILVNLSISGFGMDSQGSLLKLPLEERIRYYGYATELYEVTTEDGYILSLYRVPRRLNESPNETKNRSVVLLLHGMGGSPKNFFLLGNDSVGLGFVNQEFDVWALCSRGVDCGQKRYHVVLDRDKDMMFWEYSLDELGYYDLPVAIDFITEKTGQEKLFLLGHSAGSTLQFTLLSQRPEYNNKVKIGASYAGTIFLSQSNYPFLHLCSSLVKLGKGVWFKILKEYEFMPRNILIWVREFVIIACKHPDFKKMCLALMGVIGTHNSVLVNTDKHLSSIIQDAAMRLAAMQVFHYGDLVNSGQFIKYDFGIKNIKRYGQNTPPVYNLSAITVPIAFFYGANDGVASGKNTKRTISYLPNVVFDFLVPFKKFNHIDFVFGWNASKLVYEPTYELFKNYDKGIIPPKVQINWRKRFVNKRKTF